VPLRDGRPVESSYAEPHTCRDVYEDCFSSTDDQEEDVFDESETSPCKENSQKAEGMACWPSATAIEDTCVDDSHEQPLHGHCHSAVHVEDLGQPVYNAVDVDVADVADISDVVDDVVVDSDVANVDNGVDVDVVDVVVVDAVDAIDAVNAVDDVDAVVGERGAASPIAGVDCNKDGLDEAAVQFKCALHEYDCYPLVGEEEATSPIAIIDCDEYAVEHNRFDETALADSAQSEETSNPSLHGSVDTESKIELEHEDVEASPDSDVKIRDLCHDELIDALCEYNHSEMHELRALADSSPGIVSSSCNHISEDHEALDDRGVPVTKSTDAQHESVIGGVDEDSPEDDDDVDDDLDLLLPSDTPHRKPADRSNDLSFEIREVIGFGSSNVHLVATQEVAVNSVVTLEGHNYICESPVKFEPDMSDSQSSDVLRTDVSTPDTISAKKTNKYWTPQYTDQ